MHAVRAEGPIAILLYPIVIESNADVPIAELLLAVVNVTLPEFPTKSLLVP